MGDNNNNNSIFREKSLERVSSPEKLNDYIKVSNPSIWLVLAAIIILLIGATIYAIFGTVEMKTTDGNVKEVHPITFVVN